MDLQQLTTFAAVARHGNLTKASEELESSEPTVSRFLKSLQEQYSAQLLRRVSKWVVVPPEGKAFLSRISPTLDRGSKLDVSFKSAVLKDAPRVLLVGGTG